MSEKRRAPGVTARLLIGFVRGYQIVLSPLMGRTCRYLPTCSSYAIDAINQHGAWKGGWLGAARILRCNPWGGNGYDPVPPDLPGHGWRFWRYFRRQPISQDNET